MRCGGLRTVQSTPPATWRNGSETWRSHWEKTSLWVRSLWAVSKPTLPQMSHNVDPACSSRWKLFSSVKYKMAYNKTRICGQKVCVHVPRISDHIPTRWPWEHHLAFMKQREQPPHHHPVNFPGFQRGPTRIWIWKCLETIKLYASLWLLILSGDQGLRIDFDIHFLCETDKVIKFLGSHFTSF